MIVVQEAVEVDRPADRAWSVLADYGCDPAWRRGVATMAPVPAGPAGVGTTTAEVLRFAGRTHRSGGLVTAATPGSWFAWRTTSGVDADGERGVVPLGPGRCRVVVVQRVRPHGAQWLLVPVLRAVLGRTLRADLRRLRGLVEAADGG
jgi:uncharacterized membrane protein